ncbi:extracellular solute-binding protein [Polynucleobacter sp. MWH-Aus1W21]|jgi:iron(III) transport system substrate-binding protein|uniref:extracellular solute-binding protein n=1 Tax=Polynucleobacter sp. MWH-Aus1W21 TaxID=1855880 RepID=UPI001BFEE3B8|nr:extracellular solute-binding protein [Polynucleobacter sp. MWH-Aus1W21]QWD65515.1 extracellular solute-binding protein [Polynucleobacter sp. MWH-Aus1W21]
MKKMNFLMSGILFAGVISSHVFAADPVKELNLYSARHYQTDEALYSDFTKKTGIKINRIEADDNGILERLKSEGDKSQADVILLVDAARLWRAQMHNLFAPIKSKYLEERIPSNLRAASEAGGVPWYGYSTRARVIVYNKATVKKSEVDTYEKLADLDNKGRVCTRSGAHPYMLSLVGALIERDGLAATETWAKGMVANMARSPRGGDTDQINAVASGECGVALTNSYYFARMMQSDKPNDMNAISKVGYVWPNQGSGGVHINISGGGMAKNAPHPKEAMQFLEYLATDSAQEYFANGNNEWPAVPTVKVENSALKALGAFQAEKVSVTAIGKNQIAAQKLLDQAGYK